MEGDGAGVGQRARSLSEGERTRSQMQLNERPHSRSECQLCCAFAVRWAHSSLCSIRTETVLCAAGIRDGKLENFGNDIPGENEIWGNAWGNFGRNYGNCRKLGIVGQNLRKPDRTEIKIQF